MIKKIIVCLTIIILSALVFLGQFAPGWGLADSLLSFLMILTAIPVVVIIIKTPFYEKLGGKRAWWEDDKPPRLAKVSYRLLVADGFVLLWSIVWFVVVPKEKMLFPWAWLVIFCLSASCLIIKSRGAKYIDTYYTIN